MTRAPHILILDNRDSFVYNLARYIEELGASATVRPSHATSIADIEASAPDALLISPGPCTPREAGISLEAVRAFTGCLPILGVCLGHQAIAETFGWRINRACAPLYGEARPISHNGAGLFRDLPDPLSVGLYHSLTAEPAPETPLKITATSQNGEVMAIQHESASVFGVQFHPESILTPDGHALLANFLAHVRQPVGR